MIFFVLAALSCPEVKMQNVSGHPWNGYDKEILQQAKKRCGELYSDSPCVKLFRKWGKQDYSVICGAPNEKK